MLLGYLVCFFYPLLTIQAQTNLNSYRLLVSAVEADVKMMEKMKPEEADSYKKEIDNYNAMIIKHIEKYWKPERSIQFVSAAELKQIILKKEPRTLYIYNSKYSINYADYHSYKTTQKLYKNRHEVVENYNKKHLPLRASSIELKRTDLPDDKSTVASAALPSIAQEEFEIVYGIKSLLLQIDYKSKGTTEIQLMKMYIKNAPRLKDLTLMIDATELDSETKKDIKSFYKLPFELSNKKAIQESIINADSNKAVLLVLPNADGSFTFKAIDASSMEVLGQSGSIPPSEYYPELNDKIKGNNLEEITHYCN